jgi:hypothetical protein
MIAGVLGAKHLFVVRRQIGAFLPRLSAPLSWNVRATM